jgi:hypothetical protein
MELVQLVMVSESNIIGVSHYKPQLNTPHVMKCQENALVYKLHFR